MKHGTALTLYLTLSGAIFLLVGVFHLLRLLRGWPLVVGSAHVPPALSWVGFPVATAYAVWAGWLLRRRAPQGGAAPTVS